MLSLIKAAYRYEYDFGRDERLVCFRKGAIHQSYRFYVNPWFGDSWASKQFSERLPLCVK